MSSIVALFSVTRQPGCCAMAGGVLVSGSSASSVNAPSVSSVHGVGGRQSQPEKSPGCSRMCCNDTSVVVVVDMGIAVVTGLESMRRSSDVAGARKCLRHGARISEP